MGRIGIRREDKNAWERRAPLTPDHVAELAEAHGVAVRVEPSSRRVFPDRDYRASGAQLDERLDDCRVVLGIKEIPVEKLEAGRTYLYFSHTTKGQQANMPALRRMLELGSTLIDFEHIVDERGRRLIFFGRYAGHAGMIDALWALGRRLAAEGLETPFERVRLAHDYSSLDEATHHIHRIGERLRHTGLPDGLHPLVCGFTGSGNVSRGAQEIFDRLPDVEIDPGELDELAADPQRPRNVVYRVVFGRRERFKRIAGGEVDLGELDSHPERYRSAIPDWLPHLTLLVHGAFWSPRQPRVLGLDDLERAWAGGPPRLRVIADISCDISGGIEATVRPTTPDDPVYVWDVGRRAAVSGVNGNGPVILAVDNLPCQLPLEASEHFADTLVRFVPLLARCDWEQPLEQLGLPREISDAIVVHRGRLAPRYAHLEERLA